jgi:hypothetical protein
VQPLTFSPLDHRLIDKTMFTNHEKKFLSWFKRKNPRILPPFPSRYRRNKKAAGQARRFLSSTSSSYWPSGAPSRNPASFSAAYASMSVGHGNSSKPVPGEVINRVKQAVSVVNAQRHWSL